MTKHTTLQAAGRVSPSEQALEALIAPTVRGLGCEVWGIEYRPRSRGSTLKVFIEAEDGVTIEDCERVSVQIGALLDVEDPIIEPYRLEVSSPGLDRILFRREHYQTYLGEKVDVRLAFPFEGRRRFTGQLAGIEGDDIVVRLDDVEYLLPLEQVQRARIVPDFATPRRGGRTEPGQAEGWA